MEKEKWELVTRNVTWLLKSGELITCDEAKVCDVGIVHNYVDDVAFWLDHTKK